jgi:hypothetical protein
MAEERAKLAEEVLTLAVRAAPKWEANSCQLDVLFTLALVALSLGPGGVKGAVERLMGSKLQTLSRAEAGFSDRFLAELLDRSESQQDSNAPLSRLRKLFSSCQPEFTFADIAHAPGVGDIVRELCFNLFLLVGRSLQRHVVCRDLRVDDGVLALLLLGVAAKPFHVVKSMAYHA